MSNFLNFAGNQGVTFKNHGTGGGTSFTLDVSASTNSVLLTVGGVLQAPGTDYTVSGTTVTTTSSVTAGIEVLSWVIHKPGTAPVVQDNSVTGAKIALTSQAQGDVMYFNGTNWVRLGAGTSGEFLKTQGAGANPVWAVAGGGGAWELVTRTAITGTVSSVDFASLEAGYVYMFVITAVDSTSNSIEDFVMRVSDDNGSTWKSSGYKAAMFQHYNTGSTNAHSSTSDIPMSESQGQSTSASGNNGVAYCYNVNQASQKFMANGHMTTVADVTNPLRNNIFGAIYDTAAAINAVQFLFSSGSITGSSYAFITQYKQIQA